MYPHCRIAVSERIDLIPPETRTDDLNLYEDEEIFFIGKNTGYTPILLTLHLKGLELYEITVRQEIIPAQTSFLFSHIMPDTTQYYAKLRCIGNPNTCQGYLILSNHLVAPAA